MKTPDPRLRQELLDAKYKKYDDAFNNNDAAALAAFFTEDAVLVTDKGPFTVARPSRIKEYHFNNHVGKPDQYSPHFIGTAGNELCLHVQNEAHRLPTLNLTMARAYLSAHDAKMKTRTWAAVMRDMGPHGIASSQERCARTFCSKAFGATIRTRTKRFQRT